VSTARFDCRIGAASSLTEEVGECHYGRVRLSGPSFRGEVIWLTAEQGGRQSGPPPNSETYAATAFVPPQTVESGLASFVIRGFDPSEYRSPAEGHWLIVENAGPQLVRPGSIVVVTEGLRVVGFFFVHEVGEGADGEA